MLIGYMRVSKNDGSQSLDLQRDALIAAGVNTDRLYEDYVSSKKDLRPGLEACIIIMKVVLMIELKNTKNSYLT